MLCRLRSPWLLAHSNCDEKAFGARKLHVRDSAISVSNPGLCSLQVSIAQRKGTMYICDYDGTLPRRYCGDFGR